MILNVMIIHFGYKQKNYYNNLQMIFNGDERKVSLKSRNILINAQTGLSY